MTPEMESKVALITGASSGIGRAAAVRFAQAGTAVALVARRQSILEELAQEIEADGGRALALAADITHPAETERVLEATIEAFGGLDVLVNSAGIIENGTIESTSLADWDEMLGINLRAPFLLMHLAMPHLVARQGCVVNVSSVNGLRAFPGVLAYCVSKAALDQLTRCAALEMASKGVRVNAVNPGVVVTNLHRASVMDETAYAAFLEHSKTTHPIGRVGQPEEVAELIFYLASPHAGWITGATYSIDGGRGQTCAR